MSRPYLDQILPVVIAQLGQPFRVKAGLEGRP